MKLNWPWDIVIGDIPDHPNFDMGTLRIVNEYISTDLLGNFPLIFCPNILKSRKRSYIYHILLSENGIEIINGILKSNYIKISWNRKKLNDLKIVITLT